MRRRTCMRIFVYRKRNKPPAETDGDIYKKLCRPLLPQQTEALNDAGDSRKATLWHTFGLFSAAISLS